MVQEVLGFLLTDPEGTYVDCTLGGGGHAEAIVQKLGAQGKLFGIDRDEDAIRAAGDRLASYPGKVKILQGEFKEVPGLLRDANAGTVHGILLDLGVSSHQLDDPKRGFSFQGDDLLDMRMDRRQRTAAADIINGYDETQLIRVLREYGEEREARRIVRGIMRARPMTTTGQLVAAVRSLIKGPMAVKSLARVFQALRIEVNGELESLRQCLASVPALLRPGGRVVVISYHSLEDRIVKDTFRDMASDRIPSGSKYLPDRPKTAELKLLTKKPITASEAEVQLNTRARSAKLRAAERM